MKLVLGFQNYRYVDRSTAARSPLTPAQRVKRVSHAQRSYGEGKTTGEVAAELEQRYGIVEAFYRMEEDFINKALEEKYGDELEETMMMGKFSSRKADTTKLTAQIESKFRAAIKSRRFDGVIPGVPTKASLRGVSRQFRRSYARRASRPSFMDTGLYRASFRAWMED